MKHCTNQNEGSHTVKSKSSSHSYKHSYLSHSPFGDKLILQFIRFADNPNALEIRLRTFESHISVLKKSNLVMEPHLCEETEEIDSPKMRSMSDVAVRFASISTLFLLVFILTFTLVLIPLFSLEASWALRDLSSWLVVFFSYLSLTIFGFVRRLASSQYRSRLTSTPPVNIDYSKCIELSDLKSLNCFLEDSDNAEDRCDLLDGLIWPFKITAEMLKRYLLKLTGRWIQWPSVIVEERVLILKDFGIQMTSLREPADNECQDLQVASSRFIPMSSVKDVLINEMISCHRCFYYLMFWLHPSTDSNEDYDANVECTGKELIALPFSVSAIRDVKSVLVWVANSWMV